MSTPIAHWWIFLALLATVNVTAWSLAAAALERRRALMSVSSYAAARLQLLLSGVYVCGCAFRSVLPVYDIPRLGLFDTWLSDVAVGRAVATVAELSFVAQRALLLHATALSTGSFLARWVAIVLVPLIALAELCSWYAVLTTRNLWHVAENSLWGSSAALVIIAMLGTLTNCPPARRRTISGWCLVGALYVAFMFCFDVPTYWSRWTHDEAVGRRYLRVVDGLRTVSAHRVSYRWEDWRTEVVWMSLYFSVAVWLSISLISARAPAAATASAEDRRRAPADRRTAGIWNSGT